MREKKINWRNFSRILRILEVLAIIGGVIFAMIQSEICGTVNLPS